MVVEKLKSLYKLQYIHTQLDKIRIIRGELPAEVQDMEDEIEGLKTRMGKINEEIENQKKILNTKKLKFPNLQIT